MALFERDASLDHALTANLDYTGMDSNSTRVYIIDDSNNIVLVFDHNLNAVPSENFSVLETSYGGIVVNETHAFLLPRSNPTEFVAYGLTPQILDGANIPLSHTSGYQGTVGGIRYMAAIRSPTGGQPSAQFYDMATRARAASRDVDLPVGEAHRGGLMDLWSLWYINEPLGTERQLRSVRRSDAEREMDLDFDLPPGTYTGATILQNKGRALLLSNGTADKAIRNYTFSARRWALGSRPPARGNLTRSLITAKLYSGPDLIYIKPTDVLPPDAVPIPDRHDVYERLAAITGAEALQFAFARSGNDTTQDFSGHIEHQTGGLTTHRYSTLRLIANVEQLAIDSTAFGNWQSTVNDFTDDYSVVLYSITNDNWIMWRANTTIVLNTDQIAWDSNHANFVQVDASPSGAEFSDIITEGDNRLVLGVIPNNTFRVMEAEPEPRHELVERILSEHPTSEVLQFMVNRPSGAGSVRTDFDTFAISVEEPGGLVGNRYNNFRLYVGGNGLEIRSSSGNSWLEYLNSIDSTYSTLLYRVESDTWLLWRTTGTRATRSPTSGRIWWDSDEAGWDQREGNPIDGDIGDLLPVGDSELILAIIPSDTFRVGSS